MNVLIGAVVAGILVPSVAPQELVPSNWKEVVIGLLIIGGAAALKRWRTVRYNNNPQLVARDQLYNFLKGALANPRAWYMVESNKIGFRIDTAETKENSVTGLIGQVGPVKQQYRTIQIRYDGPLAKAVTMPNGNDVRSIFTPRQFNSLMKTAKRIGQELDNIAKAQQILSMLPASK